MTDVIMKICGERLEGEGEQAEALGANFARDIFKGFGIRLTSEVDCDL